jgi:hypothetical protein
MITPTRRKHPLLEKPLISYDHALVPSHYATVLHPALRLTTPIDTLLSVGKVLSLNPLVTL